MEKLSRYSKALIPALRGTLAMKRNGLYRSDKAREKLFRHPLMVADIGYWESVNIGTRTVNGINTFSDVAARIYNGSPQLGIEGVRSVHPLTTDEVLKELRRRLSIAIEETEKGGK